MDLSALPGADLVLQGLEDLEHRRASVAAHLVAVGAPRLRRCGIAVPDGESLAPEHRLYELLAQENPASAHSRYNALIRRLVRFEHACDAHTR